MEVLEIYLALNLIYVVVFHRSVIEVHNGLTFLDLIVIQIEVSVSSALILIWF